MAIAIVGTPHVNGVTNAGSIAVTITGVTAGNCLVTGVSILQGSTTAQAVITPTDTNGTWVDTGNRALALDTTNAIRHGSMSAIQKNCNAGSHTVTYTFPNGSTYAEMFVAEFSGLDTTSPLDIIPSSANASTYLTEVLSSITSPLSVGTTGTLAQADELVVAISSFFAPVGQNPQNVQDPPTGYTKLHVQQDTTTTTAAQMSYKVVAATTGVSVSWSVTTSNGVYDASGTMFTLKGASVGPTTTAFNLASTATLTSAGRGIFPAAASVVTAVTGTFTGSTRKLWRVPTTAPAGTAVHVFVFSGTSPTYAILAQGIATVDASGFVFIDSAGTSGDKAFAFVHNYRDDTASTSIFGGAGIGTVP